MEFDPTSPQPNNSLVQPNDTTFVIDMHDHSQSFPYIPVFASPLYGDSTPCLGQDCFIEHIISSNEQFIQDFIEHANINFTLKNINDSSHDPQNNNPNIISAKLLPDFTEKIVAIPTQFANTVVSSSHPPTPLSPVSDDGSGSMVKLKINENLARQIKKNTQRANGNGKTCKRAKTQKDGKSSADSIIKGQWTPDEDRILKEFVDKHGEKKWAKIATLLKKRTGKQCRERWYNHLQPNIKKGPWTLEEDIMFIEAHKKFGNKWAKIAKRIPDRSENTVKNRWNTIKRSKNIKVHNNTDEYDDSVLQAYINDVTTSSTTGSKGKKATTSSKKQKKEEKKNEGPITMSKDKGKAPVFSNLCNNDDDLDLTLSMEFPTPDFGIEECVPTRAG